MTREQKMQAVVEAADRWEREGGVHLLVALTQSVRALRALDAHTEAQEVVTLAVWQRAEGETLLVKPDSTFDQPERDWTRLGTVTLPLTPEGGR